MANPTTLSLHGELFVATARSGHWKLKVENPSSHNRWNQGYRETAFQPWSQDIPSHLYTTPSDVFRCPSRKTPGTCGLYGCDDLVAQHLAHLERWRTGLSKWLSGNGGIIVRKKWHIHGNPEKIDGLHALNCWHADWMDSFGYDLDYIFSWWFNLLWSRVTGSSVLRKICFSGMPYRSILGKTRPYRTSKTSSTQRYYLGTVECRYKEPNTSLHPCKNNNFKRQQELACFHISIYFPLESLLTRNLKWDENGRHGVNGWISGRTLGLHGAKIPGRMLYVFWRCMLAELYCTPANGKKLMRDAPPPINKRIMMPWRDFESSLASIIWSRFGVDLAIKIKHNSLTVSINGRFLPSSQLRKG